MAEQVTKSIIVKGTVDELYDVWADFTTFPQYMNNIESITPREGGLTHWVMKGPFGATFEWDAKTTLMEENSRIAWRSVDGSGMKTSGQVTFKALPHEQTQITVTLQYVPPNGTAGEIAAALFARPDQRLTEDLRNFKVYVEQGSRVKTDG